MSAFTPGPWTWERMPYERLIGGDDRRDVLVPVKKSRGVGFGGEPEDRRLIAAAPEMYEVLRYIVECVDKGICDARAQASHARAALARADGHVV